MYRCVCVRRLPLTRMDGVSSPTRSRAIQTPRLPPMGTLQVLFEAAEDLHLLSRGTRLVTTATSRYGAVAAMLMWAATGGAGVPATTFLDAEAVASGELQSAWLHWSNVGTNRSAPGLRWAAFTRLVAEGLWPEEQWEAASASEGASGGTAASTAVILGPEGAEAAVGGRWEAPLPPLVSMRSYLPHTPPALLWPEVLRGLGAGEEQHDRVRGKGAERAAFRVWPGECPLREAGGAASQAQAVIAQINGGVRHMEQVWGR